MDERCQARGDVKISPKRQLMGVITPVVVLVGPCCAIRVRWACGLNSCSSSALRQVKLCQPSNYFLLIKLLNPVSLPTRAEPSRGAGRETPWESEEIRVVYCRSSPISCEAWGRDLTKTPWEAVGAHKSQQLPPQSPALHSWNHHHGPPTSLLNPASSPARPGVMLGTVVLACPASRQDRTHSSTEQGPCATCWQEIHPWLKTLWYQPISSPRCRFSLKPQQWER